MYDLIAERTAVALHVTERQNDRLIDLMDGIIDDVERDGLLRAVDAARQKGHAGGAGGVVGGFGRRAAVADVDRDVVGGFPTRERQPDRDLMRARPFGDAAGRRHELDHGVAALPVDAGGNAHLNFIGDGTANNKPAEIYAVQRGNTEKVVKARRRIKVSGAGPQLGGCAGSWSLIRDDADDFQEGTGIRICEAIDTLVNAVAVGGVLRERPYASFFIVTGWWSGLRVVWFQRPALSQIE